MHHRCRRREGEVPSGRYGRSKRLHIRHRSRIGTMQQCPPRAKRTADWRNPQHRQLGRCQKILDIAFRDRRRCLHISVSKRWGSDHRTLRPRFAGVVLSCASHGCPESQSRRVNGRRWNHRVAGPVPRVPESVPDPAIDADLSVLTRAQQWQYSLQLGCWRILPAASSSSWARGDKPSWFQATPPLPWH